jgi:uncharacterized membrane protein YedE/YeeE
MEIIELIKQPWAWYIAGPLVGLTVPALLILGNFGISANLRHACAACCKTFSSLHTIGKRNLEYVFFIVGILIGGVIAFHFCLIQNPIIINDDLRTELATYGITNIDGMLPSEIFSWENLFTIKGFFNDGCGRFYDRFWLALCGCTSGHAISGLSNLQVPSLIATI